MSQRDIHSQRMRKIRKYVDFNYMGEITPYQKRKIKKYYDKLTAVLSQIHIKTTSKISKKRNIIIKNVYGGGMRDLRIIPIPTENSKGRVSVGKDGLMRIKYKSWGVTYYPFDRDSMIEDPISEIERVLEPTSHFRYTFRNGEYLFNRYGDKDGILIIANETLDEYADMGVWLTALVGLNFDSDSKSDKAIRDFNRDKRKKDNAKSLARRRKKYRELRGAKVESATKLKKEKAELKRQLRDMRSKIKFQETFGKG